ncbi:MAG: hypothetical protein IJL03_06155 [Lachnospiraceae bacterium]|nr:hypothetical protein [Lachnospiraceae bacterium]
MTKEDLFRSMSAIDEDILLRSENAGKNHVEREVSGKKAKGSGKKNRDLFLFGRWVAVAAVLCVGILIGIIGKNIWIEKNRHQKEPTVTPTVTPEPTGKMQPTPSATPTPDITPTGEITPTPTLIPTPTPDLTDGPVEYGDISRFIGKTAGEVIDEIGRDYRYEYWGNERDDGTTGGITFDGKVYFMFTTGKETLLMGSIVEMIETETSGHETPNINIGPGLYSGMTYSQIRDVVLDELSGPVPGSDGEGYMVYGFFQGHLYCFTWDRSPVNNSLPVESVKLYYPNLFYSLVWPGDELIKDVVAKYEAANPSMIKNHKEQYLKDLKSSFKDVPVTKTALLETVKLDEQNVVEIYEFAAYGRGATYKTEYNEEGEIESFTYTGTDASKEAYDYYLAGCLMSDGQYVASFRQDNMHDVDFGRFYRGITWTGAYAFETEAIGKTIGISVDKTNHVITWAETERNVNEEYYDYSVNIQASYLDGNSAPLTTGNYISYNGNNGGIYDENSYVLSKACQWERVQSGECRIGEETLSWELYESDPGIKKVHVYDRVNYHYKIYLVIDDVWLLDREGWDP